MAHRPNSPGMFKRDRVRTVSGAQSITDTYSGLYPVPALEPYMSETLRNTAALRQSRIRRNRSFYIGRQYDASSFDGARKVQLNYIMRLLNKSVSFLFGPEMWLTTVADNNKEILGPLLDVWDDNSGATLGEEFGQMGAATGDAFIQTTYAEKDFDGNPLSPDQKGVRVNLIDSLYVNPVFDPLDSKKINAVIVQFPFRDRKVSERGEIIDDGSHIFTQVVTKSTITEYRGKEEVNSIENKLGEINITHIPNLQIAGANFGLADADILIEVQEAMNAKIQDVSSIIDYHAAPITLIFGVKASALEKGANKTWSNLPKDGRVENLSLEGNLPASQEIIKLFKTAMHEMGSVPEFSLGKEIHFSNTSAVALQSLYMPLIELTNRKKLTYGPGLQKVNRQILKWLEIKEGLTIPEKNVKKKYKTKVSFHDPLPKDRLIQLNMIQRELELRLTTREEAMLRLGVSDPAKLIAKVDEETVKLQKMGITFGKGTTADNNKDIAATPQSEQEAATKSEVPSAKE